MSREVYRYQILGNMPFEDVETSFVLALFAAEALHGEVTVRLQASHAMSLERRTVVIDATEEAGANLNRFFLNYLRKEFGDDSFQVERLLADESLERLGPNAPRSTNGVPE